MISADDLDIALSPHSLDAEMCLLASLIIDRPQAEQLTPTLHPDDFFLTPHRIIYAAVQGIVHAGRPLDIVILRDQLRADGSLDDVGGAGYLAQILSIVPSSAHAPEYADRVKEDAALRGIVSTCDHVTRCVRDRVGDAAGHAATLADEASATMQRRSAGQLVEWSSLMDATYEAVGTGTVETVPFGFAKLDEMTGGIALGETIVLAARPSMGKSTLARNIAVNVATTGTPVGIISLEESPEKIGRNVLSAAASVHNHRVRHATDISAAEFARLAPAASTLRGLPIVISRRARTVEEIRAAAVAMRATHGVKLLIVDHLSRVRGMGRTIYEQVTHASGALSDLVKDLRLAGLILCQLNREVEHRDDPRPTMSDLRDSGAIEQDADGVLLLHRQDYYGVRQVGYVADRTAELIIAKWRDGRRGGTVHLKSELQFQRFADAAPPTPFDDVDGEDAS